MKQRKNYPKTASAFGIVAGALFVMGFLNFVFFFPAGFLALIALILAIGPDQGYHHSYHPHNLDCPSSVPHFDGSRVSQHFAGYGPFNPDGTRG